MNRKGEGMNTLGLIIVGVIAAIVGLTLLTASSNNVAQVQTSSSLTNYGITMPTANASSQITGYQKLAGVTLTNGTDGATITAGNYSITNFNGVSGYATLKTLSLDFVGEKVNITATTAEPYGYAEDGASRSISGIVIIFGALAIGMIFFLIVYKEPIVQGMMK